MNILFILMILGFLFLGIRRSCLHHPQSTFNFDLNIFILQDNLICIFDNYTHKHTKQLWWMIREVFQETCLGSSL